MQAGWLVAIGGAEQKDPPGEILEQLVKRSPPGEMVVITAASTQAGKTGHQYEEALQKLGRQVRILHFNSRAQVRQFIYQDLAPAGIFFTGGDQSRLTALLAGTELLDYLTELWRQGCTLAGTSAGAAVLGSVMIAGGRAEASPRKELVSLAPGFGWLPNTVIDQHFNQRGRFNRLLTVLATFPGILALGLDENTALFVRENIGEVVGEGTVTVLDGREMDFSSAPEVDGFTPLTVTDIRLHSLAAGYKFDLNQRR
ncbi:MAG: cyanophycinase [Bacillota bacterium]